MSRNVLFVTIDQLRADCLNGPLAAHVPTPALDRLTAQSAVFLNHHTVTTPCGPARASLLTGLYPRHHRALHNGTSLAPGLTNLALEARKLGLEPLLFGYTDSQPDPAGHHPNDPDLLSYEGVMTGFREIVEMRQESGVEWPGYLRAKGYPIAVPFDTGALYRPTTGRLGGPALYRAEDSDTAYLTDETIKHLDIRRGRTPWLAHVTFIRPHPPLVAPAPYHALIDPATLPPPRPRADAPAHPFLAAWFGEPSDRDLYHGFDGDFAAMNAATVRLLRATYLGLVAEVDHHLGRLLAWLDASGEALDTLVVVTADHGEMLGDHGLWGKASVFPEAFRVPLVIRAPGARPGLRIDAPTESVDVAPTILDWLGAEPPAGWDGSSLLPWLTGAAPADWRRRLRLERAFANPAAPNRFDRHTPGLRSDICAGDSRWRVDFGGAMPPLELPL